MKIELVPKKVEDTSEWVIIIGAAGAVGSFAVQVRFFFKSTMIFELMNYTDCSLVWLQSASSVSPKLHKGTFYSPLWQK
jgi:hypothetical protein